MKSVITYYARTAVRFFELELISICTYIAYTMCRATNYGKIKTKPLA